MSIILKGIDLPTEDQVIVIHSDGTFNEVDPFARRLMPFYEAIQIPKGHGRLIDKDELLSHLKKDPLFSLVEQYGISGVIESRPTILDKERE